MQACTPHPFVALPRLLPRAADEARFEDLRSGLGALLGQQGPFSGAGVGGDLGILISAGASTGHDDCGFSMAADVTAVFAAVAGESSNSAGGQAGRHRVITDRTRPRGPEILKVNRSGEKRTESTERPAPICGAPICIALCTCIHRVRYERIRPPPASLHSAHLPARAFLALPCRPRDIARLPGPHDASALPVRRT